MAKTAKVIDLSQEIRAFNGNVIQFLEDASTKPEPLTLGRALIQYIQHAHFMGVESATELGLAYDVGMKLNHNGTIRMSQDEYDLVKKLVDGGEWMNPRVGRMTEPIISPLLAIKMKHPTQKAR